MGEVGPSSLEGGGGLLRAVGRGGFALLLVNNTSRDKTRECTLLNVLKNGRKL